MGGWHHWFTGQEFEQALGVGDGQGSLACCSPWDRKKSDTTEWLNWMSCLLLYTFAVGLWGKFYFILSYTRRYLHCFLPLDNLTWEQYLISKQLHHPAHVVVYVVQPVYSYEGRTKGITENWMPDSISHWFQTCNCLILGFLYNIEHTFIVYLDFLLFVPGSMIIDTNVKAIVSHRVPHHHSDVRRHNTWESSLRFCRPRNWLCNLLGDASWII